MNLEDYSLSELRELAKNKNIKGYSKYKKSELIDLLTENDTTNNEDKNNESVVTDSNTTYKITNSDDKIAEGILEVLPDGYGFLRGENYLSTPDDVYISPVQIRRFKLDTGDHIKGISRMAKEGERFPSLIFVGEVNGEAPEKAYRRKKFDDLTPIYPTERIKLETEPNEYAMRMIDLMSPIGKGQRQLIIGDKKTGKTQIALDTIVNQGRVAKENGKMVCIYIAVGKTKKEIKSIYNELLKKNALSYTIMVVATNDNKTPVISLIPYVGMSIAEEYMEKGQDVLVVIDDLKKHAEVYREISLVSNKTPGREAYPADIFFLHSRLLEKGCQHKCGGSITILPIVETKGGDITDYISTNIISITDGQIVLSEKQFKKGQIPAINYGVSVSRLGGAVQTEDMKKLGSGIRRELLSYLETKEVYELANMDEMSPELREKMRKGKLIEQALRQNKFSPLTQDEIKERFKMLGEDAK